MVRKKVAQSLELNVALIAANLAWSLYLIGTPSEQFERSIVWKGALGATPGGSVALLGAAFGVAGVLLLVGQRVEILLYAGFLLALGTWGLMTYSFLFSAIVNRADGNLVGLGAGGFVSGALTIFIHYFALRYRK